MKSKKIDIEKFIMMFVLILNEEFGKYPEQDITGYRAIEVIRRVFEKY